MLGLLPLVFAHGAAQLSRRDVGTPIFAGMIAASAVGLFLIPMLYVSFQYVSERLDRWRGIAPPAPKDRSGAGPPASGDMGQGADRQTGREVSPRAPRPAAAE